MKSERGKRGGPHVEKSETLPPPIAAQLNEAMRCYQHAFYLATLALARTCLQSALEEQLGIYQCVRGFNNYITALGKAERAKPQDHLIHLINYVSSVVQVGPPYTEDAQCVRRIANAAIYGEMPATKESADKVLKALDLVFEKLYLGF